MHIYCSVQSLISEHANIYTCSVSINFCVCVHMHMCLFVCKKYEELSSFARILEGCWVVKHA